METAPIDPEQPIGGFKQALRICVAIPATGATVA